MQYNPIFNLYPDGWKNQPITSTPINADAMNSIDDTIRHIENHLSNNPFPDCTVKSVSNISANNPKNGDVLVSDGNTFHAMQPGGYIIVSDEYIRNFDLKNPFSILRGGFFYFATNLVCIDMVLEYLNASFADNSQFKIASGLPIPSLPSGINKSYGVAECYGENVIGFNSCYVDNIGDLYFVKNSDIEQNFESTGNIAIRLFYVKGN